jgi:gentisate 1,2-dioxygenase
MLNLKEQTIKELDELKPQALAKVYELITKLKRTNQAPKSKPAAADYIKVREALKQCKGSLSEDIILEREDRI